MPVRDDLLNPIPGDNPSGVYLYYDPLYDKIKEARREDDDAPTGMWSRERKVADWNQVLKLAGEALATKSKDLQLAAWLSEAYLRKEGFASFRQMIDVTRQIIEQFWDTLYPEIEDGDLEFRATPLNWLGNFNDQLKFTPLVRGKYHYHHYQESRRVGYKAEVEYDSTRLAEFNEKLAEGKISADDFDIEFAKMSKQGIKDLQATLNGLGESILALETLCDDKFGQDSPSFITIRKSVEEVSTLVRQLLNKRLETDPDPPDADAPPPAEESVQEEEASSYDAGSTSSDSTEVVTVVRKKKAGGPLAAEPVDAEDALARVVSAAKFLRAQDAYSPAPYAMLAGLRFGELRAGGESVDQNLLEAPPSELRQQMKKAAMDGNWSEVLTAAEEALTLPCARGWLDLHRYAWNACYNLGYSYINLQNTIRALVREILRDYQQLPELTLLDDTPTANGETRTWINNEVAPSAGATAAPAETYSAPVIDTSESTSSSDQYRPPDVYELAQQAAQNGRPKEGIEMLLREAAQERCGRQRFLRRAQLATLCMETGFEAVARPILEQLVAEIDSRRLEEWEPAETVAHPLVLLYRCLRRNDPETDATRALYDKLCRLDPVQAMTLAR